jgi:hypothetical protein
MKEIDVEDFSSEIFDITEDIIYDILEKFKEFQNIDQSLTYIFVKAYYLYSAKLYMNEHNLNINFNEIYSKYRIYLGIYYKSNNSRIAQDLLDELLGAFDKSFELIESLGFENINDSYEYRHFTINAFDILRKILEKKSKYEIREDIFDSEINIFINESDKIKNYIEKSLIS